MTQSSNEIQTLIRNKLKAYQNKDEIRTLHAAGLSDADISCKLEIPEAQILTQRESLGLPNRYSQDIYYSDEDDEIILSLRDEKSLRWTEIARKLNKGLTSFNIQMRYRYLDGLRTRRNRNGEPTVRACKGCRQQFLSEGFHNRFCEKCRDSDTRHVDHHCVIHTLGNWD